MIRRTTFLFSAAAFAFALALGLGVVAAHAQTFTVTNLSDTGVQNDGSLRGAVKAANAAPGADKIDFAPALSGTIVIGGTGLIIEEPVEVAGPGAGVISVEQSSFNHRVFQVKMGTPGEPVTLSGLTLRGGETEGSGGDVQNVSGQGATLTIADCNLIDGYAKENGGGVDSISEPLILRRDLIEGNEALHNGGGLWAGATAPLTIEGTEFVSNFTVEGGGAAIYGGDEAGFSTTISGSTFVGNEAVTAGGAINWITAAGGSLAIVNSTFAGNVTGTWGGAAAFSSVGSVSIEGSTVTGNEADGNFQAVGGLDNFGPGAARLVDTIVTANKVLHENTPDLIGSYAAAFDLIGDTTGASVAETALGSDLVGVDPQLAPLAANGGPVETMALPPTSPAVNKGGGALTTDARGDARPSLYPGVPLSGAPGANGADIGAYELQAPVVPTPPGGGGGSTSTPPPPAPAPPAPAKGGPKVKLVCAKSVGAAGCKFALQIVSGRPRRVGKGTGAHLVKPTPESAIAKLKLAAGKSGLLALKPKPKFAAKLASAKSILVREAETSGGKATIAYRRLPVVG